MLSLRARQIPSGPPTGDRLVDDRPGGVAKVLVTAGLGAWFVATAASQHPHRAFDRFRDYDPTGLFVPNWRFFAPEPAQHDFHLLHRVLTAGGEQTPWRETRQITPRAWRHAAWFPDRRRDKAMFDVCNELITLMAIPSVDLPATAPFRLLRAFVELKVRREYAHDEQPQGFQFLIARHTGHDADHEPDYLLASPFVRLGEEQAA
jgi:hypothetical protein